MKKQVYDYSNPAELHTKANPSTTAYTHPRPACMPNPVPCAVSAVGVVVDVEVGVRVGFRVLVADDSCVGVCLLVSHACIYIYIYI